MLQSTDARTHRGWLVAIAAAYIGLLILQVTTLFVVHRGLVIAHNPGWMEAADQYGRFLQTEYFEAVGRLGAFAVGSYLLVMLARRDARFPRFYGRYAAGVLLFEAILNFMYARGGPLYGALIPYWIRSIACAALAGGLMWVIRRAKVRSLFDREPAAVGSWLRMTIGLGALAMIAWPFFLNIFADLSIAVGGRFSPMDLTAGEPATTAVLLVSVTSGVFLVMKQGWRMKNLWIAILLPIVLVVLSVAYTIQAFALHYTF